MKGIEMPNREGRRGVSRKKKGLDHHKGKGTSRFFFILESSFSSHWTSTPQEVAKDKETVKKRDGDGQKGFLTQISRG